ncbi:MAG TPA: hypothetical protein VK457_20600, partial [Chloroflexota bacterium]|nr:hypothetical protein [Chloroflexota bacterium]
MRPKLPSTAAAGEGEGEGTWSVGKLVVLVLAALFLAACSGVAPPPPSTSAAAATITLSDENKTVQVRVGQVVDVSLRAEEGMENWQVADPDPAILAPTVNPAAAAAKGVTFRAFRAV